MSKLLPFLCSGVLLAVTIPALAGQSSRPVDPGDLVQKIRSELAGPFLDDAKPDAAVPHGEFLQGRITDSKLYPGTENDFEVYVPAQYDPAQPACLLLKLDSMGAYDATVLDNLIAKKEVPVIIGIGIVPGTIWRDPAGTPKRRALRFDRSYEFDSVNDNFPNFVLNELLPAAHKLKTHDGRLINLSPDGNAHAATGGSTGGIGSFTLAWRRPDQFSRVYSVIGTFVSMRGGHEYPALIRKTEPKPLRVFLEDGSNDAWNLLFGSWYEQNLLMESALTFAGYDVAHAWGNHGHDGHAGQVIFPDVMRWLWRDFPQPIKAGVSQNSTLQEITEPGSAWQQIPRSFNSVTGLAANLNGDVFFSADNALLEHVGAENDPVLFRKQGGIGGEAFGPDGALYAALPAEGRIIRIDGTGSHTVATGIAGHNLTVRHDGTLYVSEPGAHSDLPSRIWRITKSGRKDIIDRGLASVSGVAFSPDGSLFFAAEHTTRWIYSYLSQDDGSLKDKQAFYWLHISDTPNDSGAEDLAVDIHGNLYAATRMGIQVCDQNGRVRAILPLPSPSGPVRSLCFGGPHFDVLYATDGRRVLRRKLRVPGFAPWAAPISVPSQGPG